MFEMIVLIGIAIYKKKPVCLTVIFFFLNAELQFPVEKKSRTVEVVQFVLLTY